MLCNILLLFVCIIIDFKIAIFPLDRNIPRLVNRAANYSISTCVLCRLRPYSHLLSVLLGLKNPPFLWEFGPF